MTSTTPTLIVINMNKTTNKIDTAEVYRLASRWYYDEIRSLADCAIEACRGRMYESPPEIDIADLRGRDRASAIASWVPQRLASVVHQSMDYVIQFRERAEGVAPREFLTEWVDTALDGHEIIIYTSESRVALLASDNEGAYYQEYGEDTTDLAARTYAAMRADVWDALEARSEEWEDENSEDENSEDENLEDSIPDDGIVLGSRVVYEDGTDTDAGRITILTPTDAEVAWDSGTVTYCARSGLQLESGWTGHPDEIVVTEVRDHKDTYSALVKLRRAGRDLASGRVSVARVTYGSDSWSPAGDHLQAWCAEELHDLVTQHGLTREIATAVGEEIDRLGM